MPRHPRTPTRQRIADLAPDIGTVPDRVIAARLGVDNAVIARYRYENGIPNSRGKMISDVSDVDLLSAVVDEHGPIHATDAALKVDPLASPDRLKSLRVCLCHLANIGRIARIGRGLYDRIDN